MLLNSPTDVQPKLIREGTINGDKEIHTVKPAIKLRDVII